MSKTNGAYKNPPETVDDVSGDQDDPPTGVVDKRRFGFSFVDNELTDVYWREIGLIPGAIYVILSRFAGQNKHAWPRHITMANMIGVSRSSVKYAIRTLVKHKMIKYVTRKSETGNQQSNMYYLNDKSDWILNPPDDPPSEEGGENEQSEQTDTGSPHDPVTTRPRHQVATDKYTDIKYNDKYTEEKKKNEKYTLSPRNHGDGVRVNSDMNLLNQNKQQASQSPGRIRQAADLLYVKLHSAGKLTARPSLAQWENRIKKFITSADGELTLDAFELELNWYVENIGGEYVPHAFSADGFCNKFHGIREARLRAERSKESNSADSSNDQECGSGLGDVTFSKTTRIISSEDADQLLRDCGAL